MSCKCTYINTMVHVVSLKVKSSGSWLSWICALQWRHNGAMASQIISLTIDYSTIYSGADQRKHQSSVSLAFVWGIHRWLVNSPHKWPVTRKIFPVDDIIMCAVYPMGFTHGFVMLCFVVVLLPYFSGFLSYNYPHSSSESLHWHWDNHMIVSVPVKWFWRIWVKLISI